MIKDSIIFEDTTIGKGVKMPIGARVGRNCKIACWAEGNDFASENIASGESVDKKIRDATRYK